MIYLIISLFLYGLIPIVGLINLNKINILFLGLIANIPIFLFLSDISFIKNNFKEISIAGILRGTASIAYFYAYDIGYGPIVVSLVFLVPLIFALLSSIQDKCVKNLDLVILSSLGTYMLSTKMPNFNFDWKFLVAISSPVFSALSLFYFKSHIKTHNIKDTVSTVLVRNIYTLIFISLIFNSKISFNWSIDILYSVLYGILILGVAMIGFFHASKLVESKKFAILTNLEFIISFIIMIFVFNIQIVMSQWLGFVLCIISLFILKKRSFIL